MWGFVREQVEEEATVQGILDKIKLGGDSSKSDISFLMVAELKFTCICCDFLMRYTCVKSTVNPVWMQKTKNRHSFLFRLFSCAKLNLIANSSYKGFETEKLHLLFQSTYFLNSGNYKADAIPLPVLQSLFALC